MMRLSALLCAVLLITQVVGEYGVAHFSEYGESRGEDYCVLFISNWTPLPHHILNTSAAEVYDLTPSVLCSDSDVPHGGFSNTVVMVMYGNCTFQDKVDLAKINTAKGLLIVTSERVENISQYEDINFPLALISYVDMLDINMRFRNRKQVVLYSPHRPSVDYGVVVMFFMAVGTVAAGGYWTGVQEIKKQMNGEESQKLNITPTMITLWVGMCSVLLVILYLFYNYLVYIYIVFFCLCSTVGLYKCLWLIVCRFPGRKCRIPENNLPYLKKRPDVRMFLLSLFCLSVSITWGVFRNDHRWAWVLQDILGVVLCIYILKTLRLPSFRACTLLLVTLLLYDVFFVFITPYITKTKKSIMAEVGAGPSDSSEKLPILLKVPLLNFSAVVLCRQPFLLLGFGDILIPGMLIGYCHRFDVLMQSSRVYFVFSTVGYSVGLLTSGVFVYVMGSAQPALLYLVPCSLLFSLVVALCRSELKLFWNGGPPLPAAVTQTLTSFMSENSANQEPDVGEVTSQGEALPPLPEEEHLERKEDAAGRVN